MPVAKKGSDSSSAVEALKAVSLNEPKKNFTLLPKKEKGQKGDKGKSGGEMVTTYIKSVQDHMLRHYEMFAITQIDGNVGTPLNIMDLIYYHTFGDYRMVYTPPVNPRDSGKIEFQYQTLNPSTIGDKSAFQGLPIEKILDRDQLDGINYVYASDPLIKKESYSVQQVGWLDDELNEGSAGMRLMLPSIGTLMMTTYGYANINSEFKTLMTKLLDKLNYVLRSIKENDDVLSYLVEAIKEDKRFAAVQSLVEREQTLEQVLTESLDKESEDGWEDAIKYFTTQLIESTTSRYAKSESVTINKKSSLSTDVQQALADAVGITNNYEDETFAIAEAKGGKGASKYTYSLEYEGTLVLQLDGSPLFLEQKTILPSGEPDAKSRFIEKKKKAFIAIPEPPIIVFYSIMVDQMFALQAYLMTIKGADKLNFGYLSPTIMTTKKSEASAKMFPSMYKPTLDSPPAKDKYLKKGKKISEKQSFLFQLLQHRNYYTTMILTTQRNLAAEKRGFDEFYSKDLMLKEVEWLAVALSDEAKVLVAKADNKDPLSQLVYMAPGAQGDIQLTGEADRRTVFYTVDIPMLKEVMLEYVKAFNQFTIKAAFSIESSDATPKEGQVAKALWTSIKKRSATLLENNEAIPHVFFNSLFNEVKKSAGGTNLGFDLYPPNWSSTNVLTQLTVDPAQLNTLLTTVEYQSYLNEYIDYIYTRYGNRARVASAIVTSLESYRIAAATDYKQLREEFMKMITEHEKKKQLKATNFVFRAYNVVIAIMRGQLAVPLSFRQQATAEGYENEALREQLSSRKYGERGIAAVPPEHPIAQLKRKQAEARVKEDERRSVATELERVKKAQEAREARIPSVALSGIANTGNPPGPTATGGPEGGTDVTIFGRGFTQDQETYPISVTFDNIEAYSFRVDSPTQMTAVTPSAVDGLAAGGVDVIVTKSLRLPDGTTKELSSDKLSQSDKPIARGFVYV